MKKLLIANWKSNKSSDAAREWLDVFAEGYGKQKKKSDNCRVVIAPAFPLLETVGNKTKNLASCSLAVQDISRFPAGSYTGAVSVENIRRLNVEYAILGHSERRQYFGETSSFVAAKVIQCLENNITPVICIDEDYLENQANLIDNNHLEKCVVAYEPLSAIGTGNNLSVDKVASVAKRIRELFGEVQTLYGGSVTPNNIGEYLLSCSGVLVGGASLDAKTWLELLGNCQ